MEWEEDCDCCGGIAFHIGFLGATAWFRCRDCGIEFSLVLHNEEKTKGD